MSLHLLLAPPYVEVEATNVDGGGSTGGGIDNTNPRNDNVQQIAIFAEGFNTGGGCIPQFDVCPYDVPVIPTGATVRDFTLATFARRINPPPTLSLCDDSSDRHPIH